MRLLYVTPRFPYPALTGDRVVPYHRLRVLGSRHEITLLTLYEDERELEGLAQLEPHCVAIHPIRLPSRSLASVALRGAFTRTPYQVLYYRSPELEQTLASILARDDYDVLDLFLLRLAPSVARIARVPKVLDLIDSMQLAIAERARLTPPPARWLLEDEARRVASFEREIGRRFDRLIVVGERDRELVGAPNAAVVPLGIDTDEFRPPTERSPERRIVFSGNMAFPPNVDAIGWFAEHCFPRIRAAVPDAELVIAGADPVREVRVLARQPGIRVTGFVESIAAVLQTARVAVAPMRSGSGMQNKLLEAMASALPCITTRVGLRGLEAVDGEHVVVAEGSARIADATVSLLLEPTRAAEIGRRARAFVVERHSWESVVERAEAVYEQLAAKRPLEHASAVA